MQKSRTDALRKDHLKYGSRNKNGYPGFQFYLLILAAVMLMFQIATHISIQRASSRNEILSTKSQGPRLNHFVEALHQKISRDHHTHRAESFDVEIFSAPKPFVGPDKDVNLRAIRSWQRLEPKPKITLLGQDTGYEEVAQEYGLGLQRNLDKTFLGVPLFNSMLHIANQSNATVAVIINGDIVLLQDFMTAVRRILARFKDFLIVSARYDLESVPEEAEEGSDNFRENLKNHALHHGVLHTYGGMDLWAWNPSGPRLYDGEMPHFIFGRGKYDNWLTHETIAAGRRQVIDASEAIMSIHIRHDYNLVSQNKRALLSKDTGGPFWSKGKKSKFELFINIYLSLHNGSYRNQMGSILFAPWRLTRCLEPEGSCFVRRIRPGACNCEYSGSSIATQTDPVLTNMSRIIRCGSVSKEVKEDYELPMESVKNDQEPASFGLPHTLRSVTDRVIINNTIVLTALNSGYKEVMMNWVCNIRHLNITNFIIAALDPELYKFAYTRSLPVYFEWTVLHGKNTSHVDAAYGTDAFKELTKMKSRVVLRFLKLGYNVIWTDTDIIWFKNPIQDLWSYNVDLAIQTNAPDGEDSNEIRRINSGFYLARASAKVVRTFEDVIKFAARSRMSEQPCFYDVICGKVGERKSEGDTCEYNGMQMKLLNRELYPNGITKGIWDVPRGQITVRFPDVMILHNNWVKGADAKHDRLVKHDLVMYDSELGLCKYPTLF